VKKKHAMGNEKKQTILTSGARGRDLRKKIGNKSENV
jgi:hypothetical protein